MNSNISILITNACAVSDEFLAMSSVPDVIADDDDYTRLFFLNIEEPAPWGHMDWPGVSVVGMCLRRPTNEVRRAVVTLSRDGNVRIFNTNEDESVVIDDTLANRGLVPSAIRQIGGRFYACGFYGLVFRSSADGRVWTSFDHGLHADSMGILNTQLDAIRQRDPERASSVGRVGSRVSNFTAIDGFGETNLYATGLDGLLMRYTGDAWSSLDTGTGAHLNAIHCSSNGDVIAAGYDGTVLRGMGSAVRVVSETPELTVSSIRMFQGQIYLGTTEGLFLLGENGPEPVIDDVAGLTNDTAIAVLDSVSENILWVVGHRHVWRYDGKVMQLFQHPDNV